MTDTKKDWRAALKAGDQVDVEDPEKQWLPAEVLKADEKTNVLKIHFVGYASTYDEKIKRDSERLAEKGTKAAWSKVSCKTKMMSSSAAMATLYSCGGGGGG
eukprot:TRINITY_DN10435_c0_g1_i1.p1 TRINITY_DN10435_c0_g1~~TRINITY_DN10435_c0_g1_i1.p1  ORF type:complete len:102 (-),score=27.25 TRINITY_DN10435_c0_g1_i1:346-651(-)